jgi:hypothetical protein
MATEVTLKNDSESVERNWLDEQMDSDSFDIDSAYEQIHQNHIVRGIAPKWSESENMDYLYCLAQGEFEHHASLCGHRVAKAVPNPRLRSLLEKIAAASSYDPGETDLDDEQPVTAKLTLGDVRLARGLLR